MIVHLDQIRTRIGFPDVSGKGTSSLIRVNVFAGESEGEVVVSIRIGCQARVVDQRGQVDRSTLAD